MAACTLANERGNSGNLTAYASNAFTPTANDLLVAFAGVRASVDAGSFTSSDAGKTYSAVDSALYGTSTDTFYSYVADQLADADSQTGTMNVPGDTGIGCALAIIAVSGMTNVGSVAIRQSKILQNQAAGTPAITFDNPCLTGNPTIFAVAKRTDTTITEPSGWTKTSSIGHGLPDSHLIVCTRDSGFTGTTITAGGASDDVYAVIAIELDASGAGGLSIPVAEQYFRRQRAA